MDQTDRLTDEQIAAMEARVASIGEPSTSLTRIFESWYVEDVPALIAALREAREVALEQYLGHIGATADGDYFKELAEQHPWLIGE